MSGQAAAAPPAKWRVYLRLGRVSNLPTVSTNCLAGLLLAGGAPLPETLLPLLAALCCFYTGGMFLNDAYDHPFDARHRPERPIPSGEIGAGEVYGVGFALLALGEGLLALPGLLVNGRPGVAPLLAGAVLGGLIVFYNRRHKSDPLSPLVMALCRAMVYVVAASLVVWPLVWPVQGGALVLVGYLIGLTYVAKQENLKEVRNLWPLLFLAVPFVYTAGALTGISWAGLFYLLLLAWVIYGISFLLRREGRNIPRAVVSLIAGISLLDGLLIAEAGGDPLWAGACVLGFALTLFLQRYVPGT
ncbi:MAG: UbiA family prenyltransferase [SAR324 cluster bacterium]|nr:UbiA family prenyltransferase [SAR324 cluster bacterium]